MKTYKKLASPYLLWTALFILVPVIMVLHYAFTSAGGHWSLENFARFFSGGNISTLLRSLKLALITTVCCLILGYPLAYILTKMKSGFRTTALMLIIVPMWMNFLLRTYAWVTILSRNGILNMILKRIGLGSVDILYTETAVVLGMIYNFLPFMVLPIYTILEKMDHGLLEAASDLGCNKRQVFTKVLFPLSLPGIISGISMVFIPAISTFEITALLGGNKTNLIGNVIEQKFTATGEWNYGSSMAVILMLFLIISLIFTKDEGKENRKKNNSHTDFDMAQDAIMAEEEKFDV